MRSPRPQSCQITQATATARPPRRWTRWRHWLGLGPPHPPVAGGPALVPPADSGAPGPEAATWAALVRLLPADLEATARATGARQRRRAIHSATALLWLVLAYAVADWSLRLVAAVAVPRGIGDLSHVAVRARLRAARPWVQQVVSTLLGLTRAAALTAPVRLRLVDATTVSAPGSTGTDWRVHASVWLASDGPPRLDQVDLTDVHGAESLRRHPVAPGDILLADRGHARRADLGALLAPPPPPPTAGAPPAPAAATPVQVVVRIGWQNLPLQQPTPARSRRRS